MTHSIKFMIIAAPRSGTSWAANWLNTPDRFCFHEPLWDFHYQDADQLEFPGKEYGIACTGMAFWWEWLNDHPAPKVILHRPPNEVNASLRKLNLPPAPSALFKSLDKVNGLHRPWTDLYRDPRALHEHLLFTEPFDELRHRFLASMIVNTNYVARVQNMDVWKRLKAEGKYESMII